MAGFPQPNSPGSIAGGTYDAWNRLAAVGGFGTLILYSYDGLHRRTTKTVGTITNVRHFYYSSQWRVLEERAGTSTSPDRQFVWGLRYIDDLVLRDRGSERLYSLQDANSNVTAIVGNPGGGWGVQERYRYSAYGASAVLDSGFNLQSGNISLYDWETRFAGYQWDEESALYLVRFRYLNPSTGSWLCRDLIDTPTDNVNLYRYVINSPASQVDPLGLDTEAIDIVIAFGPFFQAGSWKGTFVWSCVEGHESSKEPVSNPGFTGWTGGAVFGVGGDFGGWKLGLGVFEVAVRADTSAWEDCTYCDETGNEMQGKRYHVVESVTIQKCASLIIGGCTELGAETKDVPCPCRMK